jgi:hypothetical protein
MTNQNGNNAVAKPLVFGPTNDVPDKAPKPQMDLTNPLLSFDDVLPSNYFSMEDLQMWLEERDAVSRVLTVTGCTVEYVYDPEKGEESGDWKPCLGFEETATLLVINKSRGMQLKKLTRSPFLKDWAEAGQVTLRPGIANGKAQIVIEFVIEDPESDIDAKMGPARQVVDVDGLNDELFS